METKQLRVNMQVETPVGRGVVEGQYADGTIIVAVKVQGTTRDHRCVTPFGFDRSIWAFPASELRPVAK